MRMLSVVDGGIISKIQKMKSCVKTSVWSMYPFVLREGRNDFYRLQREWEHL